MIPAFVPMFIAKPTALIDILRDLSLTTSLRLCLDAGDSRSYDGSAQLWKDTSGGGFDFNRGTTTGSETSDPTFNGNAGRQSVNEFFSYDGGDFFTLGQANPSWVNSIHKDSAVFTILAWAYGPDLTQNVCTIGTASIDGIGFEFANSAAANGTLAFACFTATTTPLSAATTTLKCAVGWNMMGVSFTESAGTMLFTANGAFEALTGQTYSGPSAAAATYLLNLGALGNGHGPESSGNRIAGVAMWDRALSQAEMTALFAATRAKFGI